MRGKERINLAGQQRQRARCESDADRAINRCAVAARFARYRRVSTCMQVRCNSAKVNPCNGSISAIAALRRWRPSRPSVAPPHCRREAAATAGPMRRSSGSPIRKKTKTSAATNSDHRMTDRTRVHALLAPADHGEIVMQSVTAEHQRGDNQHAAEDGNAKQRNGGGKVWFGRLHACIAGRSARGSSKVAPAAAARRPALAKKIALKPSCAINWPAASEPRMNAADPAPRTNRTESWLWHRGPEVPPPQATAHRTAARQGQARRSRRA